MQMKTSNPRPTVYRVVSHKILNLKRYAIRLVFFHLCFIDAQLEKAFRRPW